MKGKNYFSSTKKKAKASQNRQAKMSPKPTNNLYNIKTDILSSQKFRRDGLIIRPSIRAGPIFQFSRHLLILTLKVSILKLIPLRSKLIHLRSKLKNV